MPIWTGPGIVVTNLLYIVAIISRRHPIIYQSWRCTKSRTCVSTFQHIYVPFYIQTTPLSYMSKPGTRRVASINFQSRKRVDRHLLLTICYHTQMDRRNHRCATIVCTIELYQACNAVKALCKMLYCYQPWPFDGHYTVF